MLIFLQIIVKAPLGRSPFLLGTRSMFVVLVLLIFYCDVHNSCVRTKSSNAQNMFDHFKGGDTYFFYFWVCIFLVAFSKKYNFYKFKIDLFIHDKNWNVYLIPFVEYYIYIWAADVACAWSNNAYKLWNLRHAYLFQHVHVVKDKQLMFIDRHLLVNNILWLIFQNYNCT